MRKPIHVVLFIFAFLITSCVQDNIEGKLIETSTVSPAITPSPTAGTGAEGLINDPPPARAEAEFITDFSIHSVPFSEILSGGPPKDGISAIDFPSFQSVESASEWLDSLEPVIFVQVGEDARAYPIQILIWHEIVNDTVGDKPLVITFCPLCNTAIAFTRVVNGQETTFGTTGRLRYSNLIMYDRLSETWWQQATGEAIAGVHTGDKLEFYPVVIISWEEFKSNYPDGTVLSRETGYNRNYGRNPYVGYDNLNRSPFLYQGPPTPDQLAPLTRVITIDNGDQAVAYPYDLIAEVGVINDLVGKMPVVLFWQPNVSSPLDTAAPPGGRTVGTAAAFSPLVKGEQLTFIYVDGVIFDEETGSEWNIFGHAISGQLEGETLAPVVAINHFWFSWAAFKPDTIIYSP